MSYRKYCDELFSVEKPNLLIASEEEIKVLNQIEKPESICIDYEVLDENLTTFICKKGAHIFSIFNDDSESNPWTDYIDDIKNKVTDFDKYRFVQQTISSMESKFRIYSFLFDTISSSSIEYTNFKSNQSLRIYTDGAKKLEKSQEELEDSRKELNSSKEELVNAKKDLKEANGKSEQISENLKNANKMLSISLDSMQNILPNLLTVLGIFVSIIIAVVIIYITFFLENDINNLLNSILQLQIGKYILSAHLLGNVMFLFMFMVAKLTKRSILSTCFDYILDTDKYTTKEEKEKFDSGIYSVACANCKHYNKCSFYERVIKKASYIIYFNIAMIFFYFIVYMWWILDFYWYLNASEFFKSPDLVGLILSVLLVILVVAFSITIFKKSKNTSSSRMPSCQLVQNKQPAAKEQSE